MGERRQARELALQALFYLDMDDPDFGRHDMDGSRSKLADFCDLHQDRISPGGEPFFSAIVKGVMAGRDRIDGLLNQYSKNWKLSRMPVVDRNIMRIATFELLDCPDIPGSVSINEAVEIAKKYGTRDSGPFINGVLDRIFSRQSAE